MRYLSCPVKNATLLRIKEWINEIATSPNLRTVGLLAMTEQEKVQSPLNTFF